MTIAELDEMRSLVSSLPHSSTRTSRWRPP